MSNIKIFSTISFVIVSAAVIIALFGYLSANTTLGLSDTDKQFGYALSRLLSSPGDAARVSDIKSDTWSTVCIITAYERPSRVAAKILNIPPSALRFIDSHDTLASDDLWGVVFLSPPNLVEYRRIHSRLFYAGDSTGCIPRAQAYLEVHAIPRSTKQMLFLISK